MTRRARHDRGYLLWALPLAVVLWVILNAALTRLLGL